MISIVQSTLPVPWTSTAAMHGCCGGAIDSLRLPSLSGSMSGKAFPSMSSSERKWTRSQIQSHVAVQGNGLHRRAARERHKPILLIPRYSRRSGGSLSVLVIRRCAPSRLVRMNSRFMSVGMQRGNLTGALGHIEAGATSVMEGITPVDILQWHVRDDLSRRLGQSNARLAAVQSF
jgi:hypothetical protein